ncbi:hypothetical protein J6590_072405 [Homalodisca vitripennis]|nr:hypothetical protein J6590_072405 [Homalodisca vitripennis]
MTPDSRSQDCTASDSRRCTKRRSKTEFGIARCKECDSNREDPEFKFLDIAKPKWFQQVHVLLVWVVAVAALGSKNLDSEFER